MWKEVLLVCFACSLFSEEVSAQGGAESVPFHGFIPFENVRAKKPVGDKGPNDVYGHLPVRTPKLLEGEIAIYPHHFGFEYGQDPERKVYEIHNVKELAADRAKKLHREEKPQHARENNHNSLMKKVEAIPAPLKHDRPPPLIHPTFPTPKQQQQHPKRPQGSKVHPHFG